MSDQSLRDALQDLRSDLDRSYPARALYDIPSTVVDRLDALLAAHPAEPAPVVTDEAGVSPRSHDAVGIPMDSNCPARHPESGALCIESPGHEGEHRAMGVSRLQWFGANLREASAKEPHLITTNNTGYFWCSCSPNHARVFRGLREHIAEISSPTCGGEAAAPLLDREAVWRGIYSAAVQHLNPSGVADKATDAVMALLNPPAEGNAEGTQP